MYTPSPVFFLCPRLGVQNAGAYLQIFKNLICGSEPSLITGAKAIVDFAGFAAVVVDAAQICTGEQIKRSRQINIQPVVNPVAGTKSNYGGQILAILFTVFYTGIFKYRGGDIH